MTSKPESPIRHLTERRDPISRHAIGLVEDVRRLAILKVHRSTEFCSRPSRPVLGLIHRPHMIVRQVLMLANRPNE